MRVLLAVWLVVATSAQAQTPPPVTAPPAPTPPAETWVARAGVDLAALDKITARVSPLTGRVGQPLHFGTLTVTVRSCIVRGPDQPADQAAFLDVTDSREANFSFHGWMLLSAPGVSVLEHPVYDIRLTGCRA